MVRTRYAPSPTGIMHIGNLKTAIVEYLVARSNNGKFILRIEDTDTKRLVGEALDAIYNTLKLVGIKHDEGPDVGGDYGPYTQSERRGIYLEYAEKLVEKGAAYYCFCTKERLETLAIDGVNDAVQYDRHCVELSKDEVKKKLADGETFVIRQLIPEGKTTFVDGVFGEITVDNSELDDQILIKSDGLPTYNFANVVDDHLMEITHVIRGSEYLSSTPKYNLLYEAFGWKPPAYVHTTLLLNENGEKMSKRKGDASFEDLLELGFLPEAIVNYVALLGWSPTSEEYLNRELFTLDELGKIFDIKGMSKSPMQFDTKKLEWFNGEYIKNMPSEKYFEVAEPYLKKVVTRSGIDLKKIAELTKSRVSFIKDCGELVDFIDAVPKYDVALYSHKKMKTDAQISLEVLEKLLPFVEGLDENNWVNDWLYSTLCAFAEKEGLKNGQVLWPIRTALSGKPTTPCGASELVELFGKEETVKRIKDGINLLKS